MTPRPKFRTGRTIAYEANVHGTSGGGSKSTIAHAHIRIEFHDLEPRTEAGIGDSAEETLMRAIEFMLPAHTRAEMPVRVTNKACDESLSARAIGISQKEK